MGISAGTNTTGARNYLAGKSAGLGSTISDLIVIGDSAADAGLTDSTNLTGTLAFGSNALSALTTAGTSGPVVGSIIALGRNAAPVLTRGSADILIGENVLLAHVAADANPCKRNIIVGRNAVSNQIAANPRAILDNVIIGDSAANLNTGGGDRDINTCVVIGSQALSNYQATGLNGVTTSVFIGYQVALNYDANGSAGSCVVIGSAASPNLGKSGNTCVGASTGGNQNTTGACMFGASANALGNGGICIGQNATMVVPADTNVICIGAGCGGAGAESIYIGSGAHGLTGVRNIGLGSGAGSGETATNTDRFIVESFITAVRRACLYADMNAGNLVLGNSAPGTNRDLNGTNTVKLINGTIGGVNPVGGGYFYVTAGALHWVGSAGTDTAVAPA